MNKIVRISHDEDAECPMDWNCQWTLISFSRKSIHRGNFEDYLKVKDGEVIPLSKYKRKFGNGHAFLLDYYEHGLGCYSLRNEGMQCQWDTSQYAGVLIWNHPASDMGAKTLDARASDARGFLDTYNNWMNGHVYGYEITDEDGETMESCWGFYDGESISGEIASLLSPGDRIMLEGDCADVFETDKLPSSVELVFDFELV